MVVAGGYNRGEYLDSTEVYDYTGLWKTSVAKLPTPRMARGGMLDGYNYLFGKYTENSIKINTPTSLIYCRWIWKRC